MEKEVQMASLLLISSLVLMCFAGTVYGKEIILFSSLQRNLVVEASPKPGQVLKSGVDKITVTWGLNQTFPAGTDAEFKKVNVKLCFAPISQKDRAWRKTNNEMIKDKSCQFSVVKKAYNSSKESFEWTIERDVPSAIFFVRAYVLNSADNEVGYGQTTDSARTTNLFEIQAITGRHSSLDIAAGCFSAFSVISLFGFFFLEKRKAKRSEKS